ncbi:signal peptide peptidase SppA [Xenorhabdus szentirmaii]|uniref:Protease 4 n=1 Tax=Xenorhabdus szentirmaii DSM 16338 TaxID=1427518 RepID=W1ITY7_9GAMM|nr:signal peptide peptidase SppA [Xenorhabdus szentirmaii]PHM32472.1 signal peptide peptidase SppA [Xenorhabdus szentirmaii DSM 16338]PHM41223.1 signal peptide peptidase SppA [Xenorhabdus szentirmaii]CDL80695.1 Protease 4 [Xenorhabdus szentirmaii DSM 16338]
MRILWNFIAAIFKWSWRLLNFVRQLISNLIFILLIVVIAVFFVGYKQQSLSDDDYKGALYVNLSGVVLDQVSAKNPLGQLEKSLFGASGNNDQETSLFDIVDSIRRAKNDPKINGMVLKLNDFVGSDQPSMKYIGKAINEFKATGKPVFAIGDNYTQSQYYLASFANEIYLSPQGAVDIHGLTTNHLYYKTLLDSLKVSTHIFRVGTYKSAVEPMLRDNMSEEAREADSLWLNEIWDSYLNTIAANRHIPANQVFPGSAQFVEKLRQVGGDFAQYAYQNKLVNYIEPNSIVEKRMKDVFGWDEEQKHFNYISIHDYIARKPLQDSSHNKGNIAVIIAEGTLSIGQQASDVAGSDTIVEQLRAAHSNPDIKAIVLRVNSPGGSIGASEIIRAELNAIREDKANNGKNTKPIVVSMGGLAASGGYWISTPADYIIADPNTLTGSIGVFGIVQTFEKTLDHIGVNTDGVSTTSLANISATKGLNQIYSDVIQLSIENGYSKFISLIAKARNQSEDDIKNIAQGRVWSGLDAKKHNLVDQLGDFDDAVKKAAELAGIKDASLNWMLPSLSFPERMMLGLTSSAQAMLPNMFQAMLPAPLTQATQDLKKQAAFYNNLNDPQNIYTYCLNCTDVR